MSRPNDIRACNVESGSGGVRRGESRGLDRASLEPDLLFGGAALKTFRVRNWRKYQRYTDRRPKWFAVYLSLREDLEYNAMLGGIPAPTDAEIGQIIGLFCLAARHDDPDTMADGPDLPADPAWVQKQAGLSSKPNLERLESLCVISCNNLLQPVTKSTKPAECFCASENSTEQNSTEQNSIRDLPESERLCRLLRDSILDHSPKARVPTPGDPGWTRWVAEMDLMLRRDSRTEDEAAAVIRWATTDSFWKANVLSPSKLRKQFDRLTIQMRRPAAGTRKDHTEDTKAALKEALRIMGCEE